ncbi:hypothetical protein [Brevundimonas aurantiaca]|jgi:hypothetical protein|uniref:hypothetical protein n=1 Tax=Brevundimonas aurantiaca TaxID=74316 RepID=UPI000C9772A0|nr:hypothetical protein [Brevundimonas sp.]
MAYFSASHLDSSDFTAGEIARITGIKPAAQRDWRRRGLLARPDQGWARHRVDDLIEIMVRGVMSDLGMPHLSIFLDINDLKREVLRWAIQAPDSVYKPDDSLQPVKIYPPKYQYACATAPWPEYNVPFILLKDASAVTSFLGQKRSLSCTTLDLKKIAETIVEAADKPLWTLKPGPDEEEIQDAYRCAGWGDLEAQEALIEIGIDWAGEVFG